jgi:hypothetical protein
MLKKIIKIKKKKLRTGTLPRRVPISKKNKKPSGTLS